jgi:putative membrane protein
MFAKFSLSVAVGWLLLACPCDADDGLPADADFVGRAENIAHGQVEAAKLALQQSQAGEVRKIAGLLQCDGATEIERLATLAVENGWPSPVLAGTASGSTYSDRDWVEARVAALTATIAMYQEEADHGVNTDLKEFALETLPTLQERLVALRALHVV